MKERGNSIGQPEKCRSEPDHENQQRRGVKRVWKFDPGNNESGEERGDREQNAAPNRHECHHYKTEADGDPIRRAVAQTGNEHPRITIFPAIVLAKFATMGYVSIRGISRNFARRSVQEAGGRPAMASEALTTFPRKEAQPVPCGSLSRWRSAESIRCDARWTAPCSLAAAS